MEHLGRRMQVQVLHGGDFRLLPAAEPPVVRDPQHVVGEVLAERQIVRVGLRVQLVRRRQPDGQVGILEGKRLG